MVVLARQRREDVVNLVTDVVAQVLVLREHLLPQIAMALRLLFVERSQAPVERFAGLCDRLQDMLGAQVFLTAGPGEHPLVEQIRSQTRSHVVALDTPPDIGRLAALLAQFDAVLCHDSGPMHVAAAVGTPVVALFGPTVPAQGFGPRGTGDRTLGVTLGCRPCSAHGPQVCPLIHHRCMRDLPLEQVVGAVVATATTEDRVAIRPGH